MTHQTQTPTITLEDGTVLKAEDFSPLVTQLVQLIERTHKDLKVLIEEHEEKLDEIKRVQEDFNYEGGKLQALEFVLKKQLSDTIKKEIEERDAPLDPELQGTFDREFGLKDTSPDAMPTVQ